MVNRTESGENVQFNFNEVNKMNSKLTFTDPEWTQPLFLPTETPQIIEKIFSKDINPWLK